VSTPQAEPPGPRPPRLPRAAARAARAARGILVVVTALGVAGLVAVASLDLGPALEARAEREASRLIDRPVHIGRLSISLLRGRFVFEDLVIENRDPARPPFFSARRIVVTMRWWTLPLRREILVESVVLSDWRMRVETYKEGGHNFIRLPRREAPAGPRRFVTTVQLVRATRGEFTYDDQGAPWSVVARNLDLTITKLRDYRGEARFSGGTVRIQQFEPMWADMYCTFRIDGGLVRLDRIDLRTDGAESAVTGEVDLGRWPEQTYRVRSRVQFPRMRELFFARQTFSLAGEGQFEGTFHLFKGGRDLQGRFASAEAGLDAWRFPNLRGALRWLPDRFEVTETTSDFYGGRLALTYTMAPLGRQVPATATLDTRFEGVDLLRLTDFLELEGLRLAGRASGRHRLEYPIGRFADKRGEGEIRVTPPAGERLMARDLSPDVIEAAAALGPEIGPFNPEPLHEPLAVGGFLDYRYGPEWVDVAPSELATRSSFVAFEGRTAYGERSAFRFHVTSGDWQESDRVLAAMLTAFGARSRAVPVGGYGEFDGVMTGAFTSPRVEGRFRASRLRAWDVTWGEAEGEVAVENGYADVTGGRVRSGDGLIEVDGRFALGYPRRDGGEEINARVRLRGWPVADLRHAFGLDDYRVDGRISGEVHLYDRYERPHGFGRMTLEPAVAYGEPFERATAGLRFEGQGVRVDGLEAEKGGGVITGAAYVGWDGTYSFNADGRRIPVERIAALADPRAALSGLLQFTASGSGAFASPRYEVKGRIDDLFLRDEGIGQVSGRLVVRDEVLTIDMFEAASARLAVSGSGRVALTPEADAELLFRFQDTSIDPYVRAFEPRLSPFTTAVASGTLRIFGELRVPERTRAETVVDQLDLNLFDYRVRNDGPIRLSLEEQVVSVGRLRLVGEGTELEVAGEVDVGRGRLGLRALGDANLGLVQGVFRDLRASGDAELQAELRGTFAAPAVVGSLLVTNGRVRHFALPHGVEAINGRVQFDAGGVSLDDVTGQLGGGPVRFSGRLGFSGFTPGEYNITAVGENMRVRYPEGFRSVIDASLALRGDFFAPLLTGTVTVKSAVLERGLEPGAAGPGLLGLAPVGGPAAGATAGPAAPSRIPVRFDLRIVAPSTLRVESRAARLVSDADLVLRGTYDQPQLFGRIEIERGEVFFEGLRYQVTRGTVDFVNPARIEPFLDIEAETRARVPGQVYRVVARASGTPDRLTFTLTSDPPLATVDILSLLFGDVRNPQDAELRALTAPGQAEQDLLRARAARLLASPISGEVERVVEEAIGVDSVQITPLLGDLSAQQSSRLTAAARLTIGKRISDKLYLTYSRALNAPASDQIILLEFTQSDRLAWILSQNEDRTYALDIRVRHVF
jgi:hypothetical protein